MLPIKIKYTKGNQKITGVRNRVYQQRQFASLQLIVCTMYVMWYMSCTVNKKLYSSLISVQCSCRSTVMLGVIRQRAVVWFFSDIPRSGNGKHYGIK